MRFRNYGMIVLGKKNGALADILKVSETEPNILESPGVIIATFCSFADPKELKDFFNLTPKTFFLFDLDEDCSGFNISKKEIHEGLFGFLKNMNQDKLKQKTDELIDEITATTVVKTAVNKYHGLNVEKMSEKDKNSLVNELIDKGIDNLTDYDKELLNKLTK